MPETAHPTTLHHIPAELHPVSYEQRKNLICNMRYLHLSAMFLLSI
jgi:hypothetical protein